MVAGGLLVCCRRWQAAVAAAVATTGRWPQLPALALVLLVLVLPLPALLLVSARSLVIFHVYKFCCKRYLWWQSKQMSLHHAGC